MSWYLTARERRAVLVGVASVLRHLVLGGLLVALDFLVFWMLDQVRHQVKGDVVARGETDRQTDTGLRVLVTMVTAVPALSPGHSGGAGERVGLRLGHLQGPGVCVRRPAARERDGGQQEVSAAAVRARPRRRRHAG